VFFLPAQLEPELEAKDWVRPVFLRLSKRPGPETSIIFVERGRERIMHNFSSGGL
jgi:hypothetical protein